MYIITVLDVGSNKVEVLDVTNDGLVAQNNFLDRIAKLTPADKHISYEAMVIDKTEAYIYSKVEGWIKNSKDMYKIVKLHHLEDIDILSAD